MAVPSNVNILQGVAVAASPPNREDREVEPENAGDSSGRYAGVGQRFWRKWLGRLKILVVREALRDVSTGFDRGTGIG